MVSRLALLQSRLAWLRRLRAASRIGLAVCSAAGCFGAALLVIFALDWSFTLGIQERLFVMATAAAMLAWAGRRIFRSLRGSRESQWSVALLVERQQEIDSDLIAALQFDLQKQTTSESAGLSAAVVEYVARAAPQIDVFQSVSATPVLKSLAAASTIWVVVAILALSFPSHAAAFINRLRLGSQSYPSRTQIAQITVGPSVVYSASTGNSLQEVTEAEGAPVEFMVACTGALPSVATVYIHALSGSNSATRVELLPASSDALSSRRGQFVGRLPRLIEDVTYEILAGDARTPPARLRMTPLPIVDLALHVKPPAYAANAKPSPEASGAAHSVLEGSSLALSLHSVNHKPLKSVSISVHRGADVESIPCQPRDEHRLHWSPPATCPALESLQADLKYEVEIVDDEGLTPLSAPRGLVRVRPDAPPTGAIELVHRVVLPAARPVLRFRASDDFGIAGVELLLDVERANGTARDAGDGLALKSSANGQPAGAQTSPPINHAAQTHRYAVLAADAPVTGDQLPMTVTYTLDLAPLDLSPGDRLKLAAEITDYRGQSPGRPGGAKAITESRLIEVSDENGVLSAIRDGDQRTEQQLNDLIRRQLHLGETP